MAQRDKMGEDGPDRPVRTCVGCRTRAVQSGLVRLVAEGTAVMPDTRGRRPGRGAYLHDDRRCFELAERRRVWSRAFRRQLGKKGSAAWDVSRVDALISAAPRGGAGRRPS